MKKIQSDLQRKTETAKNIVMNTLDVKTKQNNSANSSKTREKGRGHKKTSINDKQITLRCVVFSRFVSLTVRMLRAGIILVCCVYAVAKRSPHMTLCTSFDISRYRPPSAYQFSHSTRANMVAKNFNFLLAEFFIISKHTRQAFGMSTFSKVIFNSRLSHTTYAPNLTLKVDVTNRTLVAPFLFHSSAHF